MNEGAKGRRDERAKGQFSIGEPFPLSPFSHSPFPLLFLELKIKNEREANNSKDVDCRRLPSIAVD
jgi:hypothetical protein